MKIGICQLNSITGDISGNINLIENALKEVVDNKPDLIVLPELFVQGYPPRDLLEHSWFLKNTEKGIDRLCEISNVFKDIGILTGVALPNSNIHGKGLFNSAVLILNGEIKFQQNKSLLPAYDVFDETRYFDIAPSIDVVDFKNEKLGISICEDAWNDSELWNKRLYSFDPMDELAEKGATIFINISSSPFNYGKDELRFSVMRNHSVKHNIPFLFVNQVGGNDELIFDGSSMYFDKVGNLCERLASFKEEIRVIDTTNQDVDIIKHFQVDNIANIHDALVLGLSDYMRKCGVKSALVGLSGGIDSAVTCAIAVEALGAENVIGVTMPSRYSSDGSVSDSQALADNLGIEIKTIPIANIVSELESSLSDHFKGYEPNIAEENIQARTRGTLLMALSNKYGSLVLSTGNKSELAVGYCTLYGDMNGGLSVISDLPKTMVYDLARYINRNKEIIPVSTITKEPSAELRPDQKDSDSLPPYDILDGILECLIEKDLSCEETANKGYDRKTVDWVSNALSRNEYKRRQAAPGLRVTSKAFGIGRRFPVAAKYDR